MYQWAESFHMKKILLILQEVREIWRSVNKLYYNATVVICIFTALVIRRMGKRVCKQLYNFNTEIAELILHCVKIGRTILGLMVRTLQYMVTLRHTGTWNIEHYMIRFIVINILSMDPIYNTIKFHSTSKWSIHDLTIFRHHYIIDPIAE